MKPVKTHTSLEKNEKVFGLEVLDFLIIAVVYALVFMLSTNIFLNLAAVTAVYCLLRIYKKGKPPKYTTMLVRFLLTPKFYTLTGREKQ